MLAEKGEIRDLEKQMSVMGEGLFERVGNPGRGREGSGDTRIGQQG